MCWSLGIFQKDGPGNMAFVGRPVWCRRLPVKWQLRRLAVSGQFESQRSLIIRESYGENYGKPWKLWKTMGHDGKWWTIVGKYIDLREHLNRKPWTFQWNMGVSSLNFPVNQSIDDTPRRWIWMQISPKLLGRWSTMGQSHLLALGQTVGRLW